MVAEYSARLCDVAGAAWARAILGPSPWDRLTEAHADSWFRQVTRMPRWEASLTARAAIDPHSPVPPLDAYKSPRQIERCDQWIMRRSPSVASAPFHLPAAPDSRLCHVSVRLLLQTLAAGGARSGRVPWRLELSDAGFR
jgi:hypothetical protein